MSRLAIKLTELNSQWIDQMARTTGKTPDDLVNAAVEQLATPRAQTDEPAQEPQWKAAWRQAAGMWKDRDDIPELMAQLRREWNRVEPPEGPLE